MPVRPASSLMPVRASTRPGSCPIPARPVRAAAEHVGSERAAKWWITEKINGFGDGGGGVGVRSLGLPGAGLRFRFGPMQQVPWVSVTKADLVAAPTDPAGLRNWLV